MAKNNTDQDSTKTPERLTLKQRIATLKAERKVGDLDLMTKLNQTATHINENYLFKNSTISLNEISTKVKDLSKKHNKLETKVEEVKGDVAIVKRDVAIVKRDVAAVKGDVEIVKGAVAEVKADVRKVKKAVDELSNELEASAEEYAQELVEIEKRQDNYELKSTLTTACESVAKSSESNDTRLATCTNQIVPFLLAEGINKVLPGHSVCKATCDELAMAVQNQENTPNPDSTPVDLQNTPEIQEEIITPHEEGEKKEVANTAFTKEEIKALADKGMVVIPEAIGWDAKLIVPTDQLSTIGFDANLIAKIPQNSLVACVTNGKDSVSYDTNTHACICLDDYILGNNPEIYNASIAMTNYGYSDFTDVLQVCDAPLA